MDAIVTSKVIDALVGKITDLIQERGKLHGDLRSNLKAITDELKMIDAAIKQEDDGRRRSSRGTMMTQEQWIRHISELAYDIEDCLDLYTGSPKAKSAFLGWLTRRAETLGSRTQMFAREIKALRERAEDSERIKRTYVGADPAPGYRNIPQFVAENDPVGIDEPKKEILGLLQLEGAEDCCNVGGGGSQQAVRPKSLKVVSIVGPRGLGKTTLARVVYDDSLVADGKFECRAWVLASECMDGNELLAEVLAQTGGEAATTRDAELGAKLAKHLKTKARYLIVIDDLQLHDWEAIKHAFPDNGLGGRIIVTTSVETIANTCGSERGSVYKMKTLSKKLSRELLMKKVFGSPDQCPNDDLRDAADKIVEKCDGLPLALVSIAQHLRSMRGRLTEDKMEEVCTHLGDFLENNPTLVRMKQALIRTYDSLPGHDLKNCLLSVSIFPKDYPIKKKSLVRRWLAEGLVDKANDVGHGEENRADKYFQELMDRNVIQPVDASNNATAKKSCHIHRVMLDFIVHMSVSKNFVTLVHKDTDNRRTSREVVRRLSLQNTNNSEEAPSGRTAMEIDLSRVRSLAIFNHDGKDLLKFQTCKLLRALDLEECKELKDGILDSICELLHLKYLSLRGTRVSKLPKKMYKLQALETLDIRATGVEVLPMGVLMLPKLVHLFGQFGLPSELCKAGTSRKKHQFSAEQSQLQTLAGFILDKSPGFEHILGRMKRLRKVKVWCGDAPPPDSSAAPDTLLISRPKIQLSQSIKSLSVDFGDHPISFLYNIDKQTPYSCESIKLKGKLLDDKLPDFMLSLHTLLELRLVSFDLDSKALEELGRLNRLRYLKLSDNHTSKFGNGSFHIQSGRFPSLEHMCFETPKLPQVSIQVGAMPKLAYLQLFCKDVEGLDVKDMAKLENLKEVTLAESVPAKTMKALEEAAKAHIKRPTVKTCRCDS